MKWILKFIAAAIVLATAAPAIAQVQTGSILVKSVDEQGGVIPGVNVTLTGPYLVAGSMSGVSDSGGVYRFPSLPPGPYAVKQIGRAHV